MPADFNSMKKTTNFDRLAGELDKMAKGSNSYKDDRFWRPDTDGAGNGYAVIRFLPAPPGEDNPFVRTYTHAFKGKGGWYIENSRTTINEKDPVSEMNSELWQQGEKGQEIARQRKRRLQYISNIVVLSDPKNPENEGKCFLYKYGKKIFDKISESIKPEFADEIAINPFDFWKGADFKLKIRKVAGFTNYDKSEFDSASELFEGKDDFLKTLWETQHGLNEFIDPANYKSYDELKTKLVRVLGSSGASITAENDVVKTPATSTSSMASPFDSPATETPVSSNDATVVEEDDAMSYFEKLANED
jgi:hypothetical protein